MPSAFLSPDGTHIAISYPKCIYVNNIVTRESFKIVFKDDLYYFTWSPDSQLIAGLFLERNLIKVWRLDDLAWNCTVHETMSGCNFLLWTPDSRFIISVSHHLRRATIWSLTNYNNMMYIRNIKCLLNNIEFNFDSKSRQNKVITYSDTYSTIKFSNKSHNLAIIESNMSNINETNKEDRLLIFDMTLDRKSVNWSLKSAYVLPTNELVSILWNSSDSFICLQHHLDAICYIYNVSKNDIIAKIDLSLSSLTRSDVQNSRIITTLTSVQWTMMNNCATPFLILTTFIDTIYVVNAINWKSLYSLSPPSTIDITDKSGVWSDTLLIHEEKLVKQTRDPNKYASDSVNNEKILCDENLGPLDVWESKYVLHECSQPYTFEIKPGNFANLKLSHLQRLKPKLSPDNRYLVSYSPRMPNVIWIWSFQTGKLIHVLVHLLPIKDFKWHPQINVLAICTGTKFCYFWTPESCATFTQQTTQQSAHQNLDNINNGLINIEKNDHLKLNERQNPERSKFNHYVLDISIQRIEWNSSGMYLIAMSKPEKKENFTENISDLSLLNTPNTKKSTHTINNYNNNFWRIIKFNQEFLAKLYSFN